MKRQLRGSIVLIGMMGAGKSAVGSSLQAKTGFALFETDEIIARELGSSIAEIFANHSEKKFRDAETKVLREFSLDLQSIVVTGGGIVLREENVDLLKRLGTIVWLDANDETLFERASHAADRPLLQTPDPKKTFCEILEARRPLYAKIADIHIDSSDLTATETAEKILELLHANEQ